MNRLPDAHPPVARPGVGVLLVNLGTPDAPTPGAVKAYLREFLSDPRVVEIPPLIWQPILRGVILNTRPRKSAHAYSLVWDRARDLSPLKAITQDQAAALAGAFGGGVIVDYAMRYGTPSIAERLAALKDAGCDRILVAPLYPQYCAATTATVFDEVARVLAGMRWQPSLRFLPPYHDDPAYIAALAQSVESGIAALDFKPELIIASFHGMPPQNERASCRGSVCQSELRISCWSSDVGSSDLLAAIAYWSRRSIRNIARRRPPPCSTRSRACWPGCAGSRRFASCRLIMTIRPISRRLRNRWNPGSPRSISSPN